MRVASVFLDTGLADQMDHHLCHVTGSDPARLAKCTHSRVVGLRLEGLSSEHPRSGVLYNFDRCLSVRRFTLSKALTYLQMHIRCHTIRVKFVY